MGFQVTKGASHNIRRAALLAAAAFSLSSPALAGPTPCTSDGTTWTCTLDQSAGVNLTAPPNNLDVHGLTTAITPAAGVGGISFVGTSAVAGAAGPALTSHSDLGSFGITVNGADGVLVDSVGGAGADGAVGVAGGQAGAGGAVSLTNIGNIKGTTAIGIAALSIGNTGGNGGDGAAHVTFGDDGAAGGAGGAGGTVTITNTGTLTMTGANAVGLLAESIGSAGGAGGAGGFGLLGSGAPGARGANGAGGNVLVDNHGDIVMQGDNAIGVLVRSQPGAGFGAVGTLTVNSTGAIKMEGDGAVGIFGAVPGAFGVTPNPGVTLTTAIAGGITLNGPNASAVKVQADGSSGFPGTDTTAPFTLGGDGDAGGAGGPITLNHTGAILTLGDNSVGLSAQSNGADGATGGAATFAFTTGGAGGAGGNGGSIDLTNNSAITTQGVASFGISAVAFGGNGGDGGAALAALSDVGVRGAGGNGGAITIVNAADITTQGSGAHGIAAQSSGRNASTIEILQSAGRIATSGVSADGIRVVSIAPELAGDVTVTLRGSIDASGANANAVLAESSAGTASGNITVLADTGSSLSGGTGNGAAVSFTGGNNNLLTNKGTVTTLKGLTGATVVGDTGNEVIENSGTYIGGASLGGGVNAFNNRAGGVLALGTNLDLGAVTNVLTNEGTLSPGGGNNVFTAGVNGKLVQTAAGTYALDLNVGNNTADRVNAAGTADVAGKVAIHPMDVAHFTPGAHQVTILHADGGLTDSGLGIANANTAVVSYSLSRPNAKDEALNYAIDLTPTGLALSDNQVAVADNIGAILTAGGTPAFGPVAERLFNIPTGAELSDFYADILSEPYIAPAVSTMFAADGLNNGMMSCRTQDGGPFRFSAEGECTWFQMAPRRVTRESNTPGLNSSEDLVSVNAGHQVAVNEHVRLGLAVGYQNSDVEVGSLTSVGNRGMGGLVVKYVSDPILAGLAISGGFAKNDSTRFVLGSRATSRQNAAFTGARARFAVQLLGEDNFYLRPMVDFNGGVAWVDGFREKGAGPLNLVVGDKQYAYVNVAPAVEIGGELPVYGAVMRPFVRVGMAQILSGDRQDISAQFEGAPAGVSPFVNRATLDRTLMTVDVGADLLNAGRVAARVDYAMQFGSRTMSQGVTLKLSTAF